MSIRPCSKGSQSCRFLVEVVDPLSGVPLVDGFSMVCMSLFLCWPAGIRTQVAGDFNRLEGGAFLTAVPYVVNCVMEEEAVDC